jgi:hypothetical protein
MPRELVNLKAVGSASSGTKTRISANGAEGFERVRREGASKLFEGRPALLVRSITKTSAGKEPWFGWLPEEEVAVEPFSALEVSLH